MNQLQTFFYALLNCADLLKTASSLYNDYYEPYSKFIAPIRAAFLQCQALYLRVLYPLIYPFWKLATHAVRQVLKNVVDPTTNSALTDTIVQGVTLIVLFLLSMQLLGFVRRQIMWWLRTAFTLVKYGAILLVGWHMYTFGVDETMVRGSYLASWVMGWFMGSAQEGAAQGGRLANQREAEAARVRYQGGRGSGRGLKDGRW